MELEEGAEMEGLELLAQCCEWKMSSMKLDSKWQDIEKAKELLQSHGYVQHRDDEEGGHSSIWFEKAHHEEEDEQHAPIVSKAIQVEEICSPQTIEINSIQFNSYHSNFSSSIVSQAIQGEEICPPYSYFSPCDPEESSYFYPCDGHRAYVHDFLASPCSYPVILMPVWRPCSAIQLSIPPEHQPQIKVEIPSIIQPAKVQRVGLLVVVQPSVLEDRAQFHVKLSIEKLLVGVRKEDALLEGQCIGYYTDFVSIKITPKLDTLAAPAVPTFEYLQKEDTVSVKKARTTTLGGQFGYGACHIKLNHSRAFEQMEENPKEKNFELSLINDTGNGNSAIFEWSIRRWRDGKNYNPLKQLRLKLPTEGGLADVGPFPAILWRFPRSIKDKKLEFQIHLKVNLRLIWSVKNKWGFSAFKADQKSVEFENERPLCLPEE